MSYFIYFFEKCIIKFVSVTLSYQISDASSQSQSNLCDIETDIVTDLVGGPTNSPMFTIVMNIQQLFVIQIKVSISINGEKHKM